MSKYTYTYLKVKYYVEAGTRKDDYSKVEFSNVAEGEFTCQNVKVDLENEEESWAHIARITANFVNEQHGLSIFSDADRITEVHGFQGMGQQAYDDLPDYYKEDESPNDYIESYWYGCPELHSMYVFIDYEEVDMPEDMKMRLSGQRGLF